MTDIYSKTAYIGLDAGKEGGLAWIDKDGLPLGHIKMPLNGEDDIDYIALAKVLRKMPKTAHIVTESLQAVKGVRAKATFTFARQSAFVECAITLSGLPWTKVNPKKWQAVIWNGQKILTKTIKLDNEGTTKLKTDTKKISENAFRKLFPKLVNDKTIVLRSGRLHDGIVDSYLLAMYAKRQNF